MFNDLRGKINILTKLYPYLWSKDRGIRLRFFMAGILLLAAIALNIGVPLVLREGINAISAPKSALFLAEFLLVAYGALWTFAKVIEQLRLLAMNRVVERGIRLLTLDIFENLTQLSLRYHSDRKTGGIINAVDRAQYAFPGLVWLIPFYYSYSFRNCPGKHYPHLVVWRYLWNYFSSNFNYLYCIYHLRNNLVGECFAHCQ